jgi:hypothetical protein
MLIRSDARRDAPFRFLLAEIFLDVDGRQDAPLLSRQFETKAWSA